MIQILDYFKILGRILIYLLLILFFFTILSNFNLINSTIFSYVKYILILLLLFMGGYIKGKDSSSKGWFEGIKLGIFISIILWIFNYLAYDLGMNMKLFIYMIIIIATTMLGSMFGISKKEISTN